MGRSMVARETGAGWHSAAALVQVVSWGFAAGRRAGGSRLTAAVLALAGEGMLAVLLLAAERLIHCSLGGSGADLGWHLAWASLSRDCASPHSSKEMRIADYDLN